MNAIDVLMDEHRLIERILDSLEVGALRLARGEAVRPGFFLDIADFAAGFADGKHHQKEEGILFPSLTQHGVPARGGAIEVMLEEHEAGRVLVRELRAAAKGLASAESGAAVRVIAAARGYAALLRDHIAKEDEVLFPMAAQMIPEAEQDQMMAQFARIEHDDTNGHALRELAQRVQDELRVSQRVATPLQRSSQSQAT